METMYLSKYDVRYHFVCSFRKHSELQIHSYLVSRTVCKMIAVNILLFHTVSLPLN